MTDQVQDAQAEVYERCRRELTTYVQRLVVREDVAQELVQQAAVRWLEARDAPRDPPALRAWLFRVATNLAIDHLRRHSTWRETVLLDARERAGVDEPFMAESRALRGSPEMAAIAREHLSVCFSCTLRNLAPPQAAALLLREVYGFTVEEAAEALGVGWGQAKNWVQSARATLRARYQTTCALVTKQGVCFQCVELGEFFNGSPVDPLDGTGRDVDARLAILRERKEAALGPWHRLMMRLVDEVLKG